MIQEETSLWRTSEKVMGFAGAGSNLHEYTFSLKSAVLNNGGDIQQQRHCSYSKSSLAEEWGLIWCTYLSTVRTLSSWIHHACLHDGQETAVQDVPVSAPILRPFLRIPSAPDSEGERLHDQGTQFNRKRTSAPCKHRWEKLQRSEYRLKKVMILIKTKHDMRQHSLSLSVLCPAHNPSKVNGQWRSSPQTVRPAEEIRTFKNNYHFDTEEWQRLRGPSLQTFF